MIFEGCNDISNYRNKLKKFILGETSIVPVFVKGRSDLMSSITDANLYYDTIRQFEKPNAMLVLSPSIFELLGNDILSHFSDIIYPDGTDISSAGSLLVLAEYHDFTYKNIMPIMDKNRGVRFIVGRDVSSVSWMLAKQYAECGKERASCFISPLPHGKPPTNLVVFSEGTSTIKKDLLDTEWDQLIVQGHGKDDHINIWEYTLCGRHCYQNSSSEKSSVFKPQCGYAGQGCFKDENKIISVKRLKSRTMVLSSCSSSPFYDTRSYNSDYQLILSAIDGISQTVIAANTFHNSGLKENGVMFRCIGDGLIPTGECLNDSLSDIHVHQPYLHFGTGMNDYVRCGDSKVGQYEKIISSYNIVSAYLGSGLLQEDSSLGKRLIKFRDKCNHYFQRNVLMRSSSDAIAEEVPNSSDIDSLSYAMYQCISNDPEHDIMNFENHFLSRSRIDKESVKKLPCECSAPFEQISYRTRGYLSTIPSLEMVFCYACGDKLTSIYGGTRLHTTTSLRPKDSMVISVTVVPSEDGIIYLGLFFPEYARQYIQIKEEGLKVRGKSGQRTTVTFTARISDKLPKQAYYLTVFCVHNLKVSVSRKHFGLI